MKRIKSFEEFILGGELPTPNVKLGDEKNKETYSSGCVMLYFDFPMMNKIHDGIDPNDLYMTRQRKHRSL